MCSSCGTHHSGHVGGTGPSWNAPNPNDYDDPYQNAWGWFYCKTAIQGPCNNQSQINPYINAIKARWPSGPQAVIDEWNLANPSQKFVNNPPSPPPQPQFAFWNWVKSSAPLGGQQQTSPKNWTWAKVFGQKFGHVGGDNGPGWNAANPNDYSDPYQNAWGWFFCKISGGPCTYQSQINPYINALRVRWPNGPRTVIDEWNVANPSQRVLNDPPSPPPQSSPFWQWIKNTVSVGSQQQPPPQGQQGFTWYSDNQGLGPFLAFYAWYVGRNQYGKSYKVSMNIANALKKRWANPTALLTEWNNSSVTPKIKYTASPPVVPPMSNIKFWAWVFNASGEPKF